MRRRRTACAMISAECGSGKERIEVLSVKSENKKQLSLMWKLPLWLLSAAAVLCAAYLMLELGAHHSLGNIRADIQARYDLLNLLLCAVFFCLILLLARNIWISELVCLLIFGLAAFIDYYVIEWHGMPLAMEELGNIKTALRVLPGYRFHLFRYPFFILLISLAGCAALVFLRRLFPQSWRIRFSAALACFSLCCLCTVSVWKTNKPDNPLSWEWHVGYKRYGFMASTVSRAADYGDVQMPEGYDREKLASTGFPGEAGRIAAEEYPDIILILNESFYDLSQIADVETDVPYMDRFRLLTGSHGCAVVPGSPSGTNCTEYELLTSNPQELITGIHPFNTLNLNGRNSLASYLKALGYTATAAHPAQATNYNRKSGYPAIGFERSLFISDFEDLEGYGNRSFATDASVYANLIRWYEEADEAQPRFFYLLTIQNHGGYEKNPSSYDTVHVRGDFGALTEQMDEFLTAIEMSDRAFAELTAYFGNTERKVVLCMLGDHRPDFSSALLPDNGQAYRTEQTLHLHSVPFVIWKNYTAEQEDIGMVSLQYLVPLLLREAGLPVSPFYSFLLKLREKVPVMTSFGFYLTDEGECFEYGAESPVREEVDTYLCMAYNNMRENKPIQELFYPFSVPEDCGDAA